MRFKVSLSQPLDCQRSVYLLTSYCIMSHYRTAPQEYIDAKKDFTAIRKDVFPDRSYSSVRDFVHGQFKVWKALK